MVAARRRSLRFALQTPEFGPFEFCVWRQLCPFPEGHCWPPAPAPPPGGPSLVIWLMPLEATIPFPWSTPHPRPLRLAPRPLSLASLNFASGGNYALFPRCIVGPPPLLRPPGGPGLVIWLRATMPSV